MKTSKTETATIKAPNFQLAEFVIRGTAPYVQNKFSAKARQEMRDKQLAGSRAKKGTAREGKDFEAAYKGAMHCIAEGVYGIPAPAFRNAMISACRIVGFKMTLAKLSVFCLADGFDSDDGTPLVRITEGEPHYTELAVRNASGVADLRPRPMWNEWAAKVRIRYDGDQFTSADVHNLLARAGMQVGVGEGRPDSKNTAGMGWGTFDVEPVDTAS